MKVLGGVLVAIGVAVGLYVGVWLMFIGGILELVEYVNLLVDGSSPDAIMVVWGVLKIMFAGFVGSISAYVFFIPGVKLIVKK